MLQINYLVSKKFEKCAEGRKKAIFQTRKLIVKSYTAVYSIQQTLCVIKASPILISIARIYQGFKSLNFLTLPQWAHDESTTQQFRRTFVAMLHPYNVERRPILCLAASYGCNILTYRRRRCNVKLQRIYDETKMFQRLFSDESTTKLRRCSFIADLSNLRHF